MTPHSTLSYRLSTVTLPTLHYEVRGGGGVLGGGGVIEGARERSGCRAKMTTTNYGERNNMTV